MKDAIKKWWKRIVIGLVIIAVLALLVFIGINYDESWTGFGKQQIKEISTIVEISEGVEKVTETIEEKTVPAKTLWDWLDLVVVSLVIALTLFWLNISQKRRENKRDAEKYRQEMDRQIDSQRESALQAYFDKMAELILDKGLGKPTIQDYKTPGMATVVARALTMSAFRNLDPDRNAAILRFLGDAGLARKILREMDLAGIDFSNSDLTRANLKGAFLFKANLNGTVLRNANLMEANLNQADLSNGDLSSALLIETHLDRSRLPKVNLSLADLSGASLFEADLTEALMIKTNLSRATLFKANLSRSALFKAKLVNADLRDADLSGADLSGANLSGTDLGGANLSGAKLGKKLYKINLREPSQRQIELQKQAIYTINTIWPSGFDPKEVGAILVNDEGNLIEDSDEEE